MLKPILGCLCLFMASVEAMAQPALQLELSQQLDADCQGRQLMTVSMAEPGQCIRYQLILTNLGSTAAESVKLKLPVPKNTLLKQQLSLTAGSINLPAIQLLPATNNTGGESRLEAQLDKLEAQQQVVLQYSVQVL
ncbi:hypothetical protein [Thiothrix eikelboomii]|uniref:hypothetical protein n=1 Tax=Thiothrix eikelboomii TaxID=92487 RepID=UPI003BAE89F7